METRRVSEAEFNFVLTSHTRVELVFGRFERPVLTVTVCD